MNTSTALRRALLAPLCALLLGVLPHASQAGVTDLSSQPLATMPTVKAKPNLMFILDDSGSMDSDYMPDDMTDSRNSSGKYYYGYLSAQCNGVAFDPTQAYLPPITSTGTAYPDATLAAAKNDGYSSSGSTTDLSSHYYYVYNGTQPKMGWAYTTTAAVQNTFYTECRTREDNAPALFTKVLVSSLSAADQQKYANWYSYYRKRYLLMRTAMGRAITALDSGYRVGFSTISDKGVTDGSNNFRDIKDFDATQKANFYTSLYGASPSSYTPLRAALTKAGRYFASKASGQASDPMQYSCQRNYTLLSTDGYWNTDIETTSYGPLKLDGTTLVGQQDGAEARPMRDGSTSTVTTVTTYTAPATRTGTSTRTRTATWTRTGTMVSSTPKPNNPNRGLYLITTVTQRYTETQTETNTQVQGTNYTYTTTVVSPEGAASTTSTTSATAGTWSNSGAATSSATDSGAPTASSTFTTTNTTSNTYQVAQGSGTYSYTSPVMGSWSNWSNFPTMAYGTASIGTYAAGTPVSNTSIAGGDSNSLADVAQYYYATDLRSTALGNCTSSSSGTSQDVCGNIVPTVGSDTAGWQHMNTFTIGLGVSGTLAYDKNYLTQTSGSFVDLKAGTTKWPNPINDDGASRIDDLWHAAVNGRGQYYSALNASALTEAINGVVTAVQAVTGSASAASTSSLELVAGDNNKVFGASYTTGSWTGDLKAFALTGETAAIGTTELWSAQSQLDAATPSSRNIYFSNGSALQNFEYANLSAAQKLYFDNLCTQTLVAAQCATLSASDKTLANTGSNLVAWLRGTKTYETAAGGIAALYRKREHVLGDIINGAPQFVGKPPFSYADSGYASFASANASRTAVVYTAANDGMLHAFSAATGAELWAYVPTAVMSKMYKLADASYASRHQYYVDAAPVMGDIKVGGTWKTILVGGLGGGGAGYYALDVTDPANPKALWEFTDANMGMTYGNPMIAKRADGTWVVAFTSGYNNVSGDGQGHLYVLNANTGAKLLDISTGVGSAADPSGLAKINAWVDSPSDNTAKRYYGGDLQGNLWRFDIDNLVLPNQGAMLLAKFQTNAATPQPITTKPQPAEISGKPVIVVATGRYLGTTDIENTATQSVYAVKDTLTATGWGDVRANTASIVTQTFTLTRDAGGKAISAAITDLPVDWATKGGWRVDLPQSGERVTSNMVLQFTTLAFASTIPTGNACDSGGVSWIYYLDVKNGGIITTNPAGELFSSNSLIVGLSWVQTSSGNSKIIVQGSNGDRTTATPQVDGSGASGGGAHRSSWRELVD